MRNILLTILLLFSLEGIAQKQEVIAKFNILDARFNDVDVTDWCISQKNYLVLFINEDDEYCLSNVTIQGESAGTISNVSHQEIPETSTSYEANILTFRWSFFNTYDDRKGSVAIEITMIEKPHALVYELIMIQDNMDVNIYKGFIEGTVDLSKL